MIDAGIDNTMFGKLAAGRDQACSGTKLLEIRFLARHRNIRCRKLYTHKLDRTVVISTTGNVQYVISGTVATGGILVVEKAS